MGYGKSNPEKIRERLNQSKKGYYRPDMPPVGKEIRHKVRILPPPEDYDKWYFEHGMHFNMGTETDDFTSVLCPRLTLKRRCPICEFTKGLWSKVGKDEETAANDEALARKIGPKLRFVSNMLDLAKPDTVQLWSYGKKIWQQLCEMNVNDQGTFPIDDPEEGYDITLKIETKRTPDGIFPQYDLRDNREPSAIPDKTVLDKLYDIHTMLLKDVKSYEELTRILKGETDEATAGKDYDYTKETESDGTTPEAQVSKVREVLGTKPKTT